MAVQAVIDFLNATVFPTVVNGSTSLNKIYSVPEDAMSSTNYPWLVAYEAPGMTYESGWYALPDGAEDYYYLEIDIAVANPTQLPLYKRLPMVRGWRTALSAKLRLHLQADNGTVSLLGGGHFGYKNQPTLFTSKIGPIPWAGESHWGERYFLPVSDWSQQSEAS